MEGTRYIYKSVAHSHETHSVLSLSLSCSPISRSLSSYPSLTLTACLSDSINGLDASVKLYVSWGNYNQYTQALKVTTNIYRAVRSATHTFRSNVHL